MAISPFPCIYIVKATALEVSFLCLNLNHKLVNDLASSLTILSFSFLTVNVGQ